MENGFTVQKIMLFAPAHTSALRCGGLVGHFCRADAARRMAPASADEVLNEAAIAAEEDLPRDEQGAVSADYVRLRFAAVKAAPGAVLSSFYR